MPSAYRSVYMQACCDVSRRWRPARESIIREVELNHILVRFTVKSTTLFLLAVSFHQHQRQLSTCFFFPTTTNQRSRLRIFLKKSFFLAWIAAKCTTSEFSERTSSAGGSKHREFPHMSQALYIFSVIKKRTGSDWRRHTGRDVTVICI